MRYFTYELWNKINSDLEEERLKADVQWIENAKEYEKVYGNIKNRLPKKFISIYEKNRHFHDFKLKDIKIIHGDYSTKHPVEIKVCVTDDFNTWVIKYKRVKAFSINYCHDNNSFAERRGFDDFGYDEFSIINDRVLSHEILFASGSTVMIDFETILIDSEKPGGHLMNQLNN